MAKVAVYNMEGAEVESMELNDSVFGVEINEHLVHMAVLQQLANNRQGTQKAKTRSEVRGGGRKPWRQKGTGHARQGSTRAPQWTGGGMVFAPTPRDYSFKINKKEKRIALKSVLTSKVSEEKFVVVDELKLDEIKTKKFVEVLNNLKTQKALVVLDEMNANVIASAKNIYTVKTAQVNELNVYDVLKYDTVIVTKAAVKNIEFLPFLHINDFPSLLIITGFQRNIIIYDDRIFSIGVRIEPAFFRISTERFIVNSNKLRVKQRTFIYSAIVSRSDFSLQFAESHKVVDLYIISIAFYLII